MLVITYIVLYNVWMVPFKSIVQECHGNALASVALLPGTRYIHVSQILVEYMPIDVPQVWPHRILFAVVAEFQLCHVAALGYARFPPVASVADERLVSDWYSQQRAINHIALSALKQLLALD
jgi:hypothetical protein